MIIKIANLDSEWRQAFHLLKLRFEDNDLISKSDRQYYFRSWDALLDTTLFIAKIEDQVIATTTLVWDNPYLGLPADSVYKKEISYFRERGFRLAEGGMIATVKDLSYKEAYQALVGIVKFGIAYFFYKKGDTLISSAHPKHNKFYQKKFGFELLGEEKDYPQRNNKPVQGYYLNQYLMNKLAPDCYKEIWTLPLTELMEDAILPLELVDELRSC